MKTSIEFIVAFPVNMLQQLHLPVNLQLFHFSLFLFHDFPLAGNTQHLFQYFLLINLVTSGVTAYNVDVFKKT